MENTSIFSDQIEFSLKSDMRNKKFSSNVHSEKNVNILKVAGVYGPNNVGKTCLIKCIKNIRNVLLQKTNTINSNLFSKNVISKLGVSFLEGGREFDYSFHYNSKLDEYPYEQLVEIEKDKYNNESQQILLLRDTVNKKYQCNNKELQKVLPIVSKNNILIYLMDVDSFIELQEMKEILTSFASKIDILDMNNIPLEHTIEIMKNKNNLQSQIVDFIKQADLDLDNFEYRDNDKIQYDVFKAKNGKPSEKVLDIPQKIQDTIKLTSVYKGVSVPSLLFDSTGTKKIAALASYIIEALRDGRILVIDELDSSIHFKLTRAIVAMFNNQLNDNAQLIFTTHDINLMDCKKLFRKEQIWFIHKDSDRVYLYSLADFKATQGVRDTSDIVEKYRKGLLGSLPDPDFISFLVDLKDINKDSADE
jgi:AAA15 family ATPase/GTPase